MYTASMNDLTVVIKQQNWSMEIELSEASSLGQRISNGKLLSKALGRLRQRMVNQGMTPEEIIGFEDKIFDVLLEHNRELV